MTDPTPIVKPDLSQDTLGAAESAIATSALPFIPAKVRATIYTVAGIVGVVALPVAAIVGGEVGTVLDDVAAAAAIVSGVTALAHIS
ncbi:MAG TPA: hypothetical protein VGM94_05030 [Galbitalea sp.]|jgi:hypothetical protein